MNKIDKYLNLLEKKDLYTYYHSKRVAYYSFLVGAFLNFSNKDLLNLTTSALLHDIGKIYISDDILKKEDKLTSEEYQIIKEHVLYSKIILENSFPYLVDDIIMHHERLDGSGYPYQVKELSLNAKIIGITDSFDAMTSNRKYNQIKSFDEAFKDLFSKGNLYDLKLVRDFEKALHKENVKKYYKTRMR